MRTPARLIFYPICFVLYCIALRGTAPAQVVIGPARPEPLSQVRPPKPATAKSPGVFSTLKSALSGNGPLLEAGPLTIHSVTSYTMDYGNGFLRAPGEPVNSTLQTITQAITLQLGTTWTGEASIAHSNYSSRLLDDTTDISFGVTGNWARDDWTFALSQSYAANSPIIVETGTQTAERTSTSHASGSYALTQRLSIESNATLSKRLANPEFRNTAWTGSDWTQTTMTTWLDYLPSERLKVGLGFLAGYDDISNNPDMSYTHPQARIRWTPTPKLALSLSGGVEKRKAKDRQGIRVENPTFMVSASYSPTLTTTVSLSAFRSVSTAYFNNYTVRTTNISANFSQRIFGRLFLTAGGSEGTSAYEGTTVSTATGRDDKYHSWNAGLSTAFLRRATLSLSYQESRNPSTLPEYRFSTQQTSASVAYRF